MIPCEASVDTNVFYVLGHTHAWGKRFVLTHEDRDGKATTLYDEVGGERLQFDPPIIEYPHDRPLLIRKGDKLRAQCAWQNTTDHVLRFPEEMCAALMFYYPARGFLTCHEFDSVE